MPPVALAQQGDPAAIMKATMSTKTHYTRPLGGLVLALCLIAHPCVALASEGAAEAAEPSQEGEPRFVGGTHYTVLETPVPTRDPDRIEVVSAFSYGCSRCYGFESAVQEWRDRQGPDIDFWRLHAVWNPAMEFYARAFYSAAELGVGERIHRPLFTAIVVENEQIRDEQTLALFFEQFGVDPPAFSTAFDSQSVTGQVRGATLRTRSYNLASVPELVVNGKFRVDPMRAGGRGKMLEVVDYLVEKERKSAR